MTNGKTLYMIVILQLKKKDVSRNKIVYSSDDPRLGCTDKYLKKIPKVSSDITSYLDKSLILKIVSDLNID